MKSSKTIAVDFDGVIRSWSTNKPIDGAKDGINLLREGGWKIIIHSCNRASFIEQWLNDYDIRFDLIWNQVGKPVADCYLDDCGLRFTHWPDVHVDIMELYNDGAGTDVEAVL